MMAVVHFAQGHFGRAAAVFEPLTRRHGDVLALRFNAGLAALYAEQLVKARDHLRRAVEIAPTHRRAYAYLAWIHLRREENELAGAALLEAGLDSLAQTILVADGTESHALTRQVGEAAYQLAADLSNTGAQSGEDYLEVVINEAAPGATTQEDEVSKGALDGAWSEVADGILSSLLADADKAAAAEQETGLWILRLGALADTTPTGQMNLVRQRAMLAITGDIDPVPAELLTVEGEALPEFLVCRGDGSVVIGLEDGEHQMLVGLEHEALVVSPSAILALTESLVRIEARVDGLASPLIRLSGQGHVLLSLPENTKTWPVEEGVPVQMRRDRLLGFKGNLKVAVAETMVLSKAEDLLCEGKGTILLRTTLG